MKTKLLAFAAILSLNIWGLSSGAAEIRLGQLDPESATQGYGELQIDKSISGAPLSIAGRKFAAGLGTHAASEIVYALGGKCTRFQAWVGVDDAMKGYKESSIVFQVFGDGKKLFDSGVMRLNDPARQVAVEVTGVAELKLVVTDAGDTNYCDHADWAEATLTGTLEPATPAKSALPQDLALTLGKASVLVKDNDLTVSTGRMSRTWTWNKHGLQTTSLKDLASGRDYAVKTPARQCDWDLPGAIGDTAAAKLVSVTAREDDDSGFSTKHIEVVATIRYPLAKLEIQHVVWAFPDATGLRTQLRVKALAGFNPKGLPEKESTYGDCGATFLKPSARADYLPLDFAVQNERLYWGYYNNPGNRHDQSQDMLKEQTVKGWPIFLREDIDWASGVAVKYGEAGVIVVKESPKTVNQPAHYTGAFYAKPWGLAVTGWGLTPSEIVPDRFRECWATWSILYQGGDDGLQLALKQFDAARYPVFPARDAIILANTWGPANPGGAQFTSEGFVLKELPLLGELGVDVLQIDDGWQKAGGGPGASGFLPKYKNGWTDIKAAADKANVRLGLWVAIRNANVADLNKNLDELGYISWKADFEHLASRTDYENRIAKIREVMKHAWMKTQFTLCPEYDDPRYGWYFAKEYGTIYFQNIQEALPDHLTMVPFQVLRQHWVMTKYFPANKLQVMLQNPKRVGKYSDGRQHGHGYCFAMGLPFEPVFFQSAQYLDAEGRKELKELIAVYKHSRDDIYTSLTFPIGDEPDNASWSGFQMVSTQRNGGHLLVFRELHNAETAHKITLKFLAGKTIVLTDLLHDIAPRTVQVGADGAVPFEIAQPADYRFLRYEVK